MFSMLGPFRLFASSKGIYVRNKRLEICCYGSLHIHVRNKYTFFSMGNTVALWSSIQSFFQTSELQFCNYLIWRELQNQSRFLAAFKYHQFANVAIKMLEMLVENYVSLDSNLDCKVSLHSLGSYFIWINIFACVCIDNVKCCKDGHESAPISS